MQKNISKEVIEKWLKGWSLSRGLPLPTHYKSGFRVDVGYEDQKCRYVFPQLNNDFLELANAIDEPFVFLKVCSAADTIKNKIPGNWVVQPQGYMMMTDGAMAEKNVRLDDGYKIQCVQNNTSYIVQLLSGETVAAMGRLVLVDDVAVYDRIFTDEQHRRKGLATILMKELEKIALSKGVVKNFLVATEAGKHLYQSLGWQLYTLYTTVTIAKS